MENVSVAVKDSLDSLYDSAFILPVSQARVDSLSFHTSYSLNTEVDPDRHPGVELPFSLEQADGVFGLLLLCLLFFSHIYNGGLVFFKENISLLFSSKKYERLSGETTAKETVFRFFLIFQSLILGAICLYSFFQEKRLSEVNGLSPFLNIIGLAAILGLFLLIKIWGYKFFGHILDIKAETRTWIRMNVLIIQILGILFFIPTLLLVYSNMWHYQILLFVFVLFLVLQITLFYRIGSFFVREKFNFLFLIAYLCSSEIIPCIFLAVGLFLFYQNDVFNMLL